MLNSVAPIFAEGRIYLALYAWLMAAVLVELFYESEMLSKWLARVGMLAIIALIGFRWETGTDWFPYYKLFYTSEVSSDYDSIVFGIDWGFILLNRLVYLISDDYTVFLLIDALLALGAMMIFIERSTSFPNMGVYLFYTTYAMTHFMGSNRRMLAIGFVCVGFLYMARGQPLRVAWPRWALPFALAAFVHRTSVGALPAMMVSRRAWHPVAVILGLALCLVLGVYGLPFAGLEALGGFLSQYTGITAVEKLLFYTSAEAQLDANLDIVRQATLGVAKRSTVLFIFIAYMQWGKPTEYAQRLYNIYIIGCSIYFGLIGAPIFQIVSIYYSIVEVALLPIIFYELKSLKVPYSFYLVAVPLLLLVSSLIPYQELYVPYRSVFGP